MSRDMKSTDSIAGIEATIDILSQIQVQQIIAIGHLMELSKTALASQAQFAAQFRDLKKTQKRANEKLNVLIDSIYRARRNEI
jgi:hypothetical protein